MKTAAIEMSKGYVLHMTLAPVAATGYYHFTVESQWLSARDPDARQMRYQATLPASAIPLIAHLFAEVEQ